MSLSRILLLHNNFKGIFLIVSHNQYVFAARHYKIISPIKADIHDKRLVMLCATAMISLHVYSYLSPQFKYMIFHIFICILHFYRYITNSQSGLIAQSVEHCTSITEVMGSNPVQA